MYISGSQIVAEVLLEQGTDIVFGYPGGAVLPLFDALYEYRDKLAQIVTAHEQGAAHAADGYARFTGKTGVVIATSGPGATNLVTGIAAAYMDSIPMVAITGNVSTDLIGRDSFQEVYIAGITMPVTKHNFVVRHVSELADTLRSAFKIAGSGRKGPVLVDIPKDVSVDMCEFAKMDSVCADKPVLADMREIDKTACVIDRAKRPVIYFGGGVVLSDAGEQLKQIIKKADIPATHTLMGTGVLEFGERRNCGMIGMHGSKTSNLAVENADLVIAVGTRFSDRVAINFDKFAQKAKIIHIDVDPSEINKNVLVDYGVVGDIKHTLTVLCEKIKPNTHSTWMARINEWKKNDYKPTDDESVIRPHQLMRTICNMAGDDAVYTTDVGQHQMWAAQYIGHVEQRHFLTSGGLGAMGFGYGAAIGTKLADPSKKVIHITGDGSFHMNMVEGCTAVSYNLPIISVILNNSALGMVRQIQTEFYGRRYSCSEPVRKTDYVKVAEGFGAKGYRATNLTEFKAAFADALKQNVPVWIECIIDKEEKVLPMIPEGMGIEDVIEE